MSFTFEHPLLVVARTSSRAGANFHLLSPPPSLARRWLVTEPFIVPGLYEPFNPEGGEVNFNATIVDEWTLCEALGDNMTNVLTEHYETFIVSFDTPALGGKEGEESEGGRGVGEGRRSEGKGMSPLTFDSRPTDREGLRRDRCSGTQLGPYPHRMVAYRDLGGRAFPL